MCSPLLNITVHNCDVLDSLVLAMQADLITAHPRRSCEVSALMDQDCFDRRSPGVWYRARSVMADECMCIWWQYSFHYHHDLSKCPFWDKTNLRTDESTWFEIQSRFHFPKCLSPLTHLNPPVFSWLSIVFSNTNDFLTSFLQKIVEFDKTDLLSWLWVYQIMLICNQANGEELLKGDKEKEKGHGCDPSIMCCSSVSCHPRPSCDSPRISLIPFLVSG